MARFGGKHEPDDRDATLNAISMLLSDISATVEKALELTARMHERENMHEREEDS